MNKPHKKLRVVGEHRRELDVTRFADALIAFALYRLNSSAAADPADNSASEATEEQAA
jgi:hypothetical protein